MKWLTSFCLISDNELMNQVKSGDTDKLGLLYERHKKGLFGYFFKLTYGDHQASEDLVHNVFYRALKYKHNFKGDGSFIAWIFTIAHNVGQDYHKRKQHNPSLEIPPFMVNSLSANPDDIIRNEEIKLLRVALKDLRFEDREVLILGKINELSYKEIGEIISCSEGAVKVRIHRAISSLRKAYLELVK